MAVDRPERGLWRRLDQRAVLRGAAAYVVIALPCGVLIAVLPSGGWVAAVVLIFLAAPVAGGAVAASSGDRAPLAQAAVAVTAPTTVFFVVRIVDGLVRGSLDGTLVTSLALYLVILVALAVGGGYLSFRRSSRAA